MKTLKPGEIAQYCDVHHRTVSRWIANGQLKGHKLPGRGNYRVQLDDFLAFLERQKMPIPTSLATETQSAAKLLIVADDQQLCAAITPVLYAQGYDILVANGGFQAGLMLMQFKQDLMILDLDIAGLNVFDVLDVIKQTPALNELKVVVTSGVEGSTLAKAKVDGAAAVLAKPIENSLLLSIIGDLLSK